MKNLEKVTDFLAITDVEVLGLEKSLQASGLPMMKSFNGEFPIVDTEAVEKIVKGRGKALGCCPTGEGHDNYLKGIIVQFNIMYPVFWSPQFQRYGFADIISSQSTMHCITKMNLDEIFQPDVSRRIVRYLKNLIKWYDNMLVDNSKYDFVGYRDKDNEIICIELLDKDSYNPDTHSSCYDIGKFSHSKLDIATLYHTIVSNIPQGQLKWMRVTTNYLQLKTIYQQRKRHKLSEWHTFCDFIKDLPYFEALTSKVEK